MTEVLTGRCRSIRGSVDDRFQHPLYSGTPTYCSAMTCCAAGERNR